MPSLTSQDTLKYLMEVESGILMIRYLNDKYWNPRYIKRGFWHCRMRRARLPYL